MTLLGIETSTTVCAAAVVRDGLVLAEELVDERNVHAERLMGMIDTAFQRSGTTLEDVAGIAVSIGPGSFTGLRIGLSVAKGFAYASGKNIIPVPTLLGLAQKTIDAGEDPPDELILPLLDARRGDVYCALYRRAGGRLVQEWDQQIMPLASVVEAIHGRKLLVTGDARHMLEDVIRRRFPERLQSVRIAAEDVARCSASAVARVGEEMLGQGKTSDAGLLEPQYLRDFLTTTH